MLIKDIGLGLTVPPRSCSSPTQLFYQEDAETTTSTISAIKDNPVSSATAATQGFFFFPIVVGKLI